jgi:hypothetical protein
VGKDLFFPKRRKSVFKPLVFPLPRGVQNAGTESRKPSEILKIWTRAIKGTGVGAKENLIDIFHIYMNELPGE